MPNTSFKNQVFTFNGKNYLIPRDKFENNEEYFDRSWFIIKNQPNSEEELQELIKYSFFWINNRYLTENVYSKEITDKLKTLVNS